MPVRRSAVRTSSKARALTRTGGSQVMTYFDPSTASGPPKHVATDDQALGARERFALQALKETRTREDAQVMKWITEGQYDAALPIIRRRIEQFRADSQKDSELYWGTIHDLVLTKAEDLAVSGAIASGELDLEDVEGLLLERRTRTKAGTPQYLSVNQQIADVRNAIETRDVNAFISTAYQAYIDTRDRKRYQRDLTRVLGMLKDPEARTKVQQQIAGLQTEIDNEKVLVNERKANAALVEYVGESRSAASVLLMLAQMARDATTVAESNRYVTLATQVATRERQLEQDRERRTTAAARSGTAAAAKQVETDLRGPRNSLKDAIEHLEALARDGVVPSQADWAIFWAAGDSVMSSIGQALGSGISASAADTLLKEQRSLIEDRGERKKAAGTTVLKQMDDVKTVIARLSTDAKNAKTPVPALTSAIQAQVDRLRELQGSQYLTTEQKTTAEEKVQTALAPVRDAFQTARAELADPTLRDSFRKAQSLYEGYQTRYRKEHGSDSPVSFDQWREIVSDPNTDNAAKAGFLGLALEGGDTVSGFDIANHVAAALAARDAAAREKTVLQQTVLATAPLVDPKFKTWTLDEIVVGQPDMEQRRLLAQQEMEAARTATAGTRPESPALAQPGEEVPTSGPAFSEFESEAQAANARTDAERYRTLTPSTVGRPGAGGARPLRALFAPYPGDPGFEREMPFTGDPGFDRAMPFAGDPGFSAPEAEMSVSVPEVPTEDAGGATLTEFDVPWQAALAHLYEPADLALPQLTLPDPPDEMPFLGLEMVTEIPNFGHSGPRLTEFETEGQRAEPASTGGGGGGAEISAY